MDVQNVFFDFTRSITVGSALVLGIIVLASLLIRRRVVSATLPRHMSDKSR